MKRRIIPPCCGKFYNDGQVPPNCSSPLVIPGKLSTCSLALTLYYFETGQENGSIWSPVIDSLQQPLNTPSSSYEPADGMIPSSTLGTELMMRQQTARSEEHT